MKYTRNEIFDVERAWMDLILEVIISKKWDRELFVDTVLATKEIFDEYSSNEEEVTLPRAVISLCTIVGQYGSITKERTNDEYEMGSFMLALELARLLSGTRESASDEILRLSPDNVYETLGSYAEFFKDSEEF